MRLFKGATLILILALLLRGLAALGVDAALETLIQTAVADTTLVEAAVFSQSSLLTATAGTEVVEAWYGFYDTGDPDDESEAEVDTPTLPPELTDYPPQPAPLPTITFTGDDSQNAAAGIYIRNHTTYDIDVESLLAAPLPIAFSPEEPPTVLILHTHGTESFEPEGYDWYDNTDNYRTLDRNLNITRVGREMTAILEDRGIQVLHNQDIFDYPSFRGSYGRSLAKAQQYIAAHPNIQIIFDIHRDAILDAAGSYIRTLADIEGKNSAQIMLVVGTDHAGLYHPGWRDNLAFALRLQRAMVDFHPGFARPLDLREERFNAHLAPGAVLVEIGTCGNTLQEALTAGRLFAEIVADVLLGG
ncbi:MAG: stage II sporulation protein P [Oscillospiraceae bacterium]|nr:stage II sporulation protein P [Oscillospiraceae bacterium]